jgi:hypothetical protein
LAVAAAAMAAADQYTEGAQQPKTKSGAEKRVCNITKMTALNY